MFLLFLLLVGIKMVTQSSWPNLSLLKVTMPSNFLVLWSNILLGYLDTLYPTVMLLADHLEALAMSSELCLKAC